MKIPICVISTVCVMVLLCLLGSVTAELGPDITFGTEDTEPQPINMYFYGGEEAGLAVDVPQGNTTVEVECPGHPTPRIAGYYVGTWASRPVSAPVSLGRQISCGLWAYSNEPATNVRFNVEIYLNGQDLLQFTTESVSLASNPEEITGAGQSQEPIDLIHGDIISVRLAYFSDPRYGVGPGADSVLILGDVEYDTRITITASPITVTIQQPAIEETFAVIAAHINDSFAATRYYTDIRIDGRTDAQTISEPVFTQEDNTTIVYWIWDYRIDEARDGEYRVSITVSYSEDNEFTAIEAYDMEFQKDDDDDDFISSIGWPGLVIIIIVLATCAAASYRVVSKKRSN